MELTVEQKRALALARAKVNAAASNKADNSGVENFGLGLARGARDFIDGPAYLLPKGIEKISRAVGADSVADWANSEANKVSDINKAAETEYQNATPGSVAAGFGRIGGNVASAFIPGTGQVAAAKKVNDLWQSGNRLKSLAVAAPLGATQSALFGTKTNDDSLINNAIAGGVLAPVAQVGSAGVNSAIQLGRKILAGKDGRVGGVLQRAGQESPESLINRLYSGNNVIVEGSSPTTAQAAMNPGLSQLDRTIRNSGYGALVDQDLINNQARISALDRIAPGSFNVPSSEAAQNAGQTIRSQAQVLRNALTDQVDQAYNHPGLYGATLELPDRIVSQDAVKKFYPGIAYPESPADLRSMVERLPSDGVINADSAGSQVPLKEFDAYRKLFANRWADLRDVDRTGSAAFNEVKHLFDNAEKAAINDGTFSNMTPNQSQLLGDARKLYQQNINRFETGPASYMWRTGQDGLPMANGAEISKRFFNSGASQADDIAQFAKMLPDGGAGKDALQSYAISDLLEKALNTGGDLSTGKYQSWINSRIPAIKGLFDDGQIGAMNNVGADLARAYEAQNLGRAVGSNTSQNILGSAMLDGKAGRFMRMIPFVGKDLVEGNIQNYKNKITNEVGDAMLDPTQAINSLEVYRKLMNPNLLQRGVSRGGQLAVPASDY